VVVIVFIGLFFRGEIVGGRTDGSFVALPACDVHSVRDKFSDYAVGVVWSNDWLDPLVCVTGRPYGGYLSRVGQHIQDQRAVFVPPMRIVIEPVDKITAALDTDHAQGREGDLPYFPDRLVPDAPGPPRVVAAEDNFVVRAHHPAIVIASHGAEAAAGT
jgi:hypothetical protein